ncbi:MAG: LPS export ABC transporter periplasmic protein LptC [Gemmatimonadota bacterium]|nr:LPS export ABC transporter periplasmic protein LptC [Gemmatimonadota bacterium]MDH3427587.1 LPS export ABC transporter periplasmic protein LptC [Gemmatimonadota bacterium]
MTEARRGLRSLAGVLLLVAASSGCRDNAAASGDAPSIFEGGADQVMLGVEHYMTADGVRRGRLLADTALTFEDASRVELRNPRIQFFDEAGVDRGLLTSASGEYDLESGDMTVHRNVVLTGSVRSGAPARLETDSLAFEAASNRLTTDASWILTHQDGTVERGVGLVTDPALENIETRDWSVSTPDVEVPR